MPIKNTASSGSDKSTTATVSSPFLVGAAVGSGLSAMAAQRGGADFLLALNAGWLRAKGAPSIASILPMADGNQAVLELGKYEILPQCELPVFFGANVYMAQQQLDNLILTVKQQGFVGFANFPTAIHLPTELQQAFEEHGIGFDAELSLLTKAKAAGLQTLAYVRTKQQAVAASLVGVDIICLNFGWNIGGAMGHRSHLTIDDVRVQAGAIYQACINNASTTTFLLEGGPIATAEDLAEIYRDVPIHGYIGGSTLDRMPMESSISDRTSGFKSVELLASALHQQESNALQEARALGLIGHSRAIRKSYDRLRLLARQFGPVYIQGESGSGRGFAAQALHKMSERRDQPYVELILSQMTAHEAGIRLFGLDKKQSDRKVSVKGLLERLDGGSLYIEDLSKLPKRLQSRLVRYLERGTFSPVDGRRLISSDVRIILSSHHVLLNLSHTEAMDETLCLLLSGSELSIPALRERQEDIPGLLRAFMRQILGSQFAGIYLDPSALGVLVSHSWPGNIFELRRLAARLVEVAGKNISADEILSSMEISTYKAAEYLDERDWIAHALKRNRFKRTDTAHELGLSRKTLYNKIKKYGLDT